MLRIKYDFSPEFWQKNRNKVIAEIYGVAESSVCRMRYKLVKERGKIYECRVKGWYDWGRVNWDLTNEQIQENWEGKKTPKLSTIKAWREKIKID